MGEPGGRLRQNVGWRKPVPDQRAIDIQFGNKL